MPSFIKLTLTFDIGREVEIEDQNVLVDGIIDLLEAKFPGYSGTCMTSCPVDENGDPIPIKCSHEPGACHIICDHCSHFDFNGDEDGAYVEKGYCRFHNRPADPSEGCGNYRCYTLD